MVEVHLSEGVKMPSIPSGLEVWFRDICSKEGKALQELDVVFCSDEQLRSVNREHLNHDYYTDIITFDCCVGDMIAGEMFISMDRVLDNAEKENVPEYEELCRVLAHGVLHLCGYGDKGAEEQLQMRSKEDFYLSLRP